MREYIFRFSWFSRRQIWQPIQSTFYRQISSHPECSFLVNRLAPAPKEPGGRDIKLTVNLLNPVS